jgi:hypothetical protein
LQCVILSRRLKPKAAEESQALLLQLASTPLVPITLPHIVPKLETEVPPLLQASPISSPIAPVAPYRPVCRPTFPPHVPGLLVAGSKSHQSRYRVTLCVQCVTLLNAGIPIDVICSWWLVTKFAI